MSEASVSLGHAVAGLSAEDLLERFGSPLYVYDADVISARAEALRAVLPPGSELAFAVKANSSPRVLGTLAGIGLGADVASGGELTAVRRAGFAPERIVFTGPGKTDAELAAALSVRVGALTIESLDELDALLGMADRAAPGQGLLLRLATDGDGRDTSIIGAAGNAKFGLTDAEAAEAMDRLRASGSLAPRGPFQLRGLHAFGASNVLEAGELQAGVADLSARAERLAGRHDLELELLDAGGGLGIPYADDEASLDIEAFGRGLAVEVQSWQQRPGLRGTRLLLEPGRWLTGPAGVYLCRVVRTKARDDRHIAITDGGIHHLLRPRLVGGDHAVVPVGPAADRRPDASVDVVGPLCTGIDILASAVAGPQPRRGDIYAVRDAGAYGYSESMPLFLSHPMPAEVVVAGGEVSISRERREPEAFAAAP